MPDITIGILAGMGPRSTAPFIDLVVTECQTQYGARDDIDFPRMMICSQPSPFYDDDRPVDHPALEGAIREGLAYLERAGADFLAIACNTAHIYYPSLARGVSVPLLNIVDLTVSAIPESARRLALIAARPTENSGIYQAGIREQGFEVIDIDWQSDVDHLLGATRTSTDPALFTRLWAGLTERAQAAGADTLVIACTDLSGVLAHAKTELRIVDASRCLAREIVAEWLRRREGPAVHESPAVIHPDLSGRPFEMTITCSLASPPPVVFRAWTQHIDRWFAAPGSVLMKAEVNSVYFFETRHGGKRRCPYYGRFLRLEQDRLIELTWRSVGTSGMETVITVELEPEGEGTQLRLTQRGFPDEESSFEHQQVWPKIMAHLDEQMRAGR